MSIQSVRSLEREFEELFTGRKSTSRSSGPRVPARGRKNPADRDLEEALSSALVAGDREFGNIIHEIEEISGALREAKSAKNADQVASHPAVWHAVRHILLERELRHLALSDDLTCLYNRRGFYAAATQQLKVARRNQKPAVLFFCDVDGLKAINDTYGHREGDLALVRTADALEEVFRDSDVLARLGGDEFAVLAADFSREHERAILNRLQESIQYAGREESRYQLSVSIGAGWFDPRNPAPLGELMEQADRAMYQQKHRRLGFPRQGGTKLRTNNSSGGKRDAFVLVKRKI